MKQALTFEVQDPKIFFRNLIDVFLSARSGDIIWVQSMLFEPGSYTKSIVDTLCKAKKNGAEVYVLIDSFGVLTTEEVPTQSLFRFSDLPKTIIEKNSEKKSLIDKLKNGGINFRIGGSMGKIKSTFPIMFCNHRKSYGLIKERTKEYYAWITGINIAETSFKFFDVAIKIYHEELVKVIYDKFIDDYYQKNQWENKTYYLGTRIKYLIENNSNISNIRREAYSLISNAEKYIRFITQYPVDPLLLSKLIKKSKQKIKIDILTSNKNDEFNSRKIFRYFNSNFNNKIHQNINITRGYFPGKVHAKLLFSEKESFIGSDNITMISKILQTKENMLYISGDSLLTSRLNEFYNLGWNKAIKE